MMQTSDFLFTVHKSGNICHMYVSIGVSILQLNVMCMVLKFTSVQDVLRFIYPEGTALWQHKQLLLWGHILTLAVLFVVVLFYIFFNGKFK